MAEATWSIFLGYLIFITACVFAVYYYTRFKKIFLIFFVGSLSTYLFSMFYLWDVFDLNENLVLLLLVISTGIMFYLGKYFSKIKLKEIKVHTSLKEKER